MVKNENISHLSPSQIKYTFNRIQFQESELYKYLIQTLNYKYILILYPF